MTGLEAKKLPRQERSRATFDAILEACAQVLRETGYASLTTNHVAERAGVSIGTLYEFFPGKDAIVAVLIERKAGSLVRQGAAQLESALALEDAREATGFLIRGLVDVVAADRELYRVLIREVPFTGQLPAMRRALETLFALGRAGGERASDRVSLPHLEADTWLIGRMVYQAVLEIAFAGDDAPDRDLLTRELSRLTERMIRPR